MRVSIDGHTVAHANHARRWHQRLIGLLLTREESFTGLILEPCNSVHTFGMRYPIDVVFVDRNNVAIKTCRNVRPLQFCFGGRNARYTLELPSGSIEKHDIQKGNIVELTP